jgi:DNA topoisomerase IB
MTIAAESATAAPKQEGGDADAGDLGRLIRSDPAAGGIRRWRCGRDFRYLGPDAPVTDPETLARIATIRKEHIRLTKGQLLFEYTAKGAKHREQAVAEDRVCAVVRGLKRRRGGGDQLLVFRSGPARTT